MIPWCPATLLSATLIISDIQIQKYSRVSGPPPYSPSPYLSGVKIAGMDRSMRSSEVSVPSVFSFRILGYTCYFLFQSAVNRKSQRILVKYKAKVHARSIGIILYWTADLRNAIQVVPAVKRFSR